MKRILVSIIALTSFLASKPSDAAFEDTKLALKTIKKAEHKYTCKPGQWRRVLVEWGYEVCRFLKADPSYVASATMMLDRFLDKSVIEIPEDDYLLYFATSLMIAAKQQQGGIDLNSIALLTHGRFTAGQISYAERTLCQILRWKLIDPSVEYYVDVFFQGINIDQRGDWDIAKKNQIKSVWHQSRKMAQESVAEVKARSNYDMAAEIIVKAIQHTHTDGRFYRRFVSYVSKVFDETTVNHYRFE